LKPPILKYVFVGSIPIGGKDGFIRAVGMRILYSVTSIESQTL
jgi:hypothetical protein